MFTFNIYTFTYLHALYYAGYQVYERECMYFKVSINVKKE